MIVNLVNSQASLAVLAVTTVLLAPILVVPPPCLRVLPVPLVLFKRSLAKRSVCSV